MLVEEILDPDLIHAHQLVLWNPNFRPEGIGAIIPINCRFFAANIPEAIDILRHYIDGSMSSKQHIV